MAFTTRSNRLFLLAGALGWNARWLVLGDSFVSATLPARLGIAGMYHTWPFVQGVRTMRAPCVDGNWSVNRFEGGSASNAHPYDSAFSTPIPGGSDFGIRELNGANLDFEAGLAWPATTSQQWRGLPLGATEEYLVSARTPGSGSPGLLYQHRLTLDTLTGVVNPRICSASESMVYRCYYRATSNPANQLASIVFKDGTLPGSNITLDLVNEARNANSLLPGPPVTALDGEINAHYADLPWSGTASGTVNLEFRSSSGSNRIWSHYGGTIHAPNRTGGAYLDCLSDASWSYAGHATDTASTSGTPKRFTNAEAERYMRLSTFDPWQRVVVMLNIAQESGDKSTIKGWVQSIIDRWRAICAAAGLIPPLFLLVGQANHWIDGSLNVAQVEVNQQALLEISQENADVAFISLYAITSGVLFDGSAAAQAWISANLAGGQFTYGSRSVDLSGGVLLDGSKLHLASEGAAAFMASRVSSELQTVRPVVAGSVSLDLAMSGGAGRASGAAGNPPGIGE